MRRVVLAAVTASALAMAGPANAAWNSYISHTLGFSFEAPGTVKSARTTYEAPVAGKHNAMAFEASDEGIQYRVTLVDMEGDANKAASILGEAEYRFQDGKKLRMDAFGRVDREFGRKLTVELPNGGRSTAAFYFLNGQLLELQVTAPAGSDFDSPDISRFIDSVAFFSVRARPESIELQLPK